MWWHAPGNQSNQSDFGAFTFLVVTLVLERDVHIASLQERDDRQWQQP